MFKTTGKLNKDFFDKLKAHIWSPKGKGILIFMLALCLAYSVFAFFVKDYSYAVIFIVFAIAIIIEYFLIRNRTIKVNLKRMVEMTGKEEFEYTVFFEEDGVVTQNHSTGAGGKIPFDKFVRLAKCNSVYALVTKANQMIPVFIDCLSDSEKEELTSFLKAKNSKLK